MSSVRRKVGAGSAVPVARKGASGANREGKRVRKHHDLHREILSSLRKNNQYLQFLRDVVRSSNVAIIGRKLDGTVVSWNPAARRMFGYSAKEIIGRSIRTVVPPEGLSKLRKTMAAIRRGERLEQIDVLGMKKGGTRMPMIVTVSPVWNPDGDLTGASVIARDVSEQKRAEARIRYERDRAEHYLEIAEVIILVLDRHGRIVLLNRKGCQVLGRRQRELLRRNWFTACLPRKERQTAREAFRELVSGKSAKPHYHEGPVVTRSGEERLIAWRCNFLTDENGQIVGTLSSGEDVTTGRATEEALRKLSGRLLQVRDEERRGIARELHDSTAQRLSLLSTQLARAERLSAQGKGNPGKLLHEARAVAKQALREVRSLAYLLHPPLLEEMGLASALRVYLDGLRKQHETRIDFEMPPRLDRFPSNVELSAFRIIQEALGNALRHSRSPRVRIKLLRQSGSLVVKVIDRGRGIARGANGQPASLRRHPGMGLAGMRERAHLVGGRLDVHSGKLGTTVTAVIPVARETREEDPYTLR